MSSWSGTIPQVEGLGDLAENELARAMLVKSGTSEQTPIERSLREIFIWAILSKSSDVHIQGETEKSGDTNVKVNVRSPKGFVNCEYRGPSGSHFQSKLFQLTGTPQGGSTPDLHSTRFSMELPANFARGHGLHPVGDSPYEVDVRVQYIKTYNGFTFICRLLDQQRAPKLHELGLTTCLMHAVCRAIEEPSGLILVSGPTGSGKTTLLNAILDRLNDDQRSIVTIENPVEFRLKGKGAIKQIQVQGDITFAKALRATLRADPDIILIGEIRDQETMEIALQAAQTGHLVLATIHANSAPETISRAIDLTQDKARDAYRISETLKFVMAQRLVDVYDGPLKDRSLGRDERAWLRTNGLGHMAAIRESQGGVKRGKKAIIEAIATSEDIKEVIRGDRLDVSLIYKLASSQHQYETLALAGVRAVEESGCRLKDCMTRLESTTEAEKFSGLRVELAQKFGLTLAEVSQVIDEFYTLGFAEDGKSIEDFVQDHQLAKKLLTGVVNADVVDGLPNGMSHPSRMNIADRAAEIKTGVLQ